MSQQILEKEPSVEATAPRLEPTNPGGNQPQGKWQRLRAGFFGPGAVHRFAAGRKVVNWGTKQKGESHAQKKTYRARSPGAGDERRTDDGDGHERVAAAASEGNPA